jgi:hypothetical protein
VPTLVQQGQLARAEAIDMDRGKFASPPTEESSETRRARRSRNEESEPRGKKT